MEYEGSASRLVNTRVSATAIHVLAGHELTDIIIVITLRSTDFGIDSLLAIEIVGL